MAFLIGTTQEYFFINYSIQLWYQWRGGATYGQCSDQMSSMRVLDVFSLEIFVHLYNSLNEQTFPIFWAWRLQSFQLHNYIRKMDFKHTAQNSQNKQTKISDHETKIFELKVGVKSGLEFFILKSYQPLQSCCCPVQKDLPRWAELAWQVSRYL